jgi:hypothetical protein
MRKYLDAGLKVLAAEPTLCCRVNQRNVLRTVGISRTCPSTSAHQQTHASFPGRVLCMICVFFQYTSGAEAKACGLQVNRDPPERSVLVISSTWKRPDTRSASMGLLTPPGPVAVHKMSFIKRWWDVVDEHLQMLLLASSVARPSSALCNLAYTARYFCMHAFSAAGVCDGPNSW